MTHATPHPLQPGDRVRIAEHLRPHFFGATHGTVDRLPVGTRYQDALVDIGHGVYWFAATDLTFDPLPDLPQRIRGATLTPSYVDAEAEPSTVDEYTCPEPGCDFHIAADGPVDIDEPDPFQEEVDEHRRSHESDPRDAERGTVGEVSVTQLWIAAGPHLKLFDALDINADRRAFAAAMRAVADVIDPGQ